MSEPERDAEESPSARDPDVDGGGDVDVDPDINVDVVVEVDVDGATDIDRAALEMARPAASPGEVMRFTSAAPSTPTPRRAWVVEATGLSETDEVIYAFQRNVVVAASAGTGKTHRLTALYVLLALGLTSAGQPSPGAATSPILPDRIVATTFSRAAAREIASRIEHELRVLAAWDGRAATLFGDVIRARQAALGVTLSPEEIRGRAGHALGRWSAARIDTLHGVAKQLVDRHAIALGLSPGARILEEEETQALGDLAVDETLSAALADGGERADAARALIAAAGDVDAARAQITRLLDRLDEEGLTPARLAPTDHAAEARALRLELQRLARQSATQGSPAFQAPAAALAAALGGAGEGGPLPRAAIEPARDLFGVRKPRKPTPADQELCDFRDALPGDNNKDRALELLDFLREAAVLGRREALILELLEAARGRLITVRRAEGGLGFGDLLRAARDGLRDDPAIAAAARATVDALLVDEFQDTSAVQRDLVYLLCERDEDAARRPPGVVPAAATLRRHGLFLVGDRKQSIYGFRGADVSVFCRVCAELAGAAAGRALELPEATWSADPIASFVALRESRRSTKAVLSFINAFSARDFAQGRGAPSASPLRDFEIAYSAAEELVPIAAEAAPTQVVLVADAEDALPPEGTDALVRDTKKGPLREALVAAAYVARRVRGDGPPRAGGAAPGSPTDLRFGDIAILARRRSSIPLLELALARLDVPYVVAGRALYDAPEIRDVAALLRLLLDPDDQRALATVLRGPMVALSDTALALLSPPGRGLVVPLLGRSAQPEPEGADGGELPAPTLERLPPPDRARLEAFRARFSGLRRAALRSAPGEAIRAAVSAFDLDRVLAALPRAQARIGNIDRLVSIARRRGGSLAGFTRWLDRRIRDEADEPEAAVFSPEDDAVRLVTIHGSKGLGFPAVVLVDLNAEPRGDLPGLGFIPPTIDRPAALVVRHFVRRFPLRAPRPGSRYDAEVDALAPLFPVSTPARKAATAEVHARERAERQRLTYVAITRAKRELVLIGPAGKPRSGSAWQTLKPCVEGTANADPRPAETEGTANADPRPAETEGTANADPRPLGNGPLSASLTSILDARSLLAEARPPAPGTDPYARPAPAFKPAPAPRLAAARTVAIGAAPLALFQSCPRRFRLRHLLGLEEPTTAVQLGLFDVEGPAELPGEERVELEDGADARPPGRAPHRTLERWPRSRWGDPTLVGDVLERLGREGLPEDAPDALRLAQGLARFLEGAYARRLRDEAQTMRREEALALRLDPSSEPARGAAHRHGTSLAMRGAVDLIAELPSGVDVVEYRRARPRADLSAYELPLRASALAASLRHPGKPVRAGVLFLGSSTEPVWLKADGPGGAISEEEHARFEQGLLWLAEQLAEARRADRFEGVPVETCRRLRCGFLEACHGEKDRG